MKSNTSKKSAVRTRDGFNSAEIAEIYASVQNIVYNADGDPARSKALMREWLSESKTNYTYGDRLLKSYDRLIDCVCQSRLFKSVFHTI